MRLGALTNRYVWLRRPLLGLAAGAFVGFGIGSLMSSSVLRSAFWVTAQVGPPAGAVVGFLFAISDQRDPRRRWLLACGAFLGFSISRWATFVLSDLVNPKLRPRVA